MSLKVATSPSIQVFAVDKEEATIPSFDLSEIETSKGEKRKELIQHLLHTFETIGFAALYAPPRLENAHQKIFKAAHEFFSKDSEEKKGFMEKDSLGYVPYRQEKLKEEAVDMERYRYIPGKFKIPEVLNEFGTAVEEIGKEYNSLALRLCSLFAEGIGVKLEELPITDQSYSVSIKHYPKTSDLYEGKIVHPHHRDISPITILPAGTESGLQVLINGVYKDIAIPKGCVLANTGDILCNKTAGRLRGADHRVVYKGNWPEHGRYQVAVFNDFPENFPLAPIPSLVEEAMAKIKEAYLGQFISGTEEENNLAYQWNVLGDISGATKEKINDLIQKGFFRNPTERLINSFPDCDWEKAKEADKKMKQVGLTPLFESSAL